MGDFRLFWASGTANHFGTAVRLVVVQLVAVEALGAGGFGMGLLTAAGTAAFLLIGLPAGVWVDRVRKRALMRWATTGRALLLTTVPVAWWLDVLTFGQLVVVALLTGVLTVLFDVAAQSCLPSLVPTKSLGRANGRLESTGQVARLVGQPVGGLVAQVAGSANAMLGAVVAYLGSAAALARIGHDEPAPADGRTGLWRQVAEGLRFVLGQPLVRATVACATTYNFFLNVYAAVSVLFLARDLGLPPWAVGAVLAAGGVGGALAGFVRFGSPRLVWVAPLLTGPFWLLLPLADRGWRVALVVIGLLVGSFGMVVYNVAQISLRQSLCPPGMLGRMNASARFLSWGAIPLGALAGGALAEWVGVRNTILVGAVGIILSVLWLLLSPLTRGGSRT